MALLLSAPQCFFITIIAFAIIGFQRGWRREIISLAFALAGVLFLYLGGGKGLAHFLFVRVPIITQDILSPNPAAAKPPAPPEPSDTTVFFTTLIALAAIVALGYIVGNKAFPKASAPADRILGVIPGIITGYALLNYLTYVFGNSPLITVGVSTPSPNLIGNYMLVIFVIAVVAVVIGLVAASVKKGGGAKKP